MHTGETVEQAIERIQRPGNGFGSGCTVVSRKEGETAGVPWTRFIVKDNYHGERETIYLTEGGAQVERCIGSYGDGIRWSCTIAGITDSLTFHPNLTSAFETVFRSKAASPTNQEQS